MSTTTSGRDTAPVVISPAQNGRYSQMVEFSGTGAPGWLVWLTLVPIDAANQQLQGALVDPGGKWKFTQRIDRGIKSVIAFQSFNRERSPLSGIIKFTVL
ncbi:hypothetical protein ACI77J_17475 [Pseudomonas sp. O64]|uniref:hypothetical protein n=1 Tax=Pseudomonas TaxID=286 RepID=UPI001140EC5E|nr:MULTISPECIES: hypothetical protein [unclassified Pseudomonas]MCV2231102.1 hypothetical protein [Pseudomonas sp. AU10]UNM20315.1 hypothetical protein K0P33_02250 [Pseudomonas sp. ArH3a]UXZ23079.1 hypothetical protein KZH41_02300 [Pseudomonas sp. YeP6b]